MTLIDEAEINKEIFTKIIEEVFDLEKDLMIPMVDERFQVFPLLDEIDGYIDTFERPIHRFLRKYECL